MDYEKNVCPYDVGQLLTAHEVIEWAIEQDDRLNNSINTSTIIDVINDAITNEVVRQVRINRLEDYTTRELEEELELRKSK
jgi:uncharacterized membrane protein YqjE